MGLSYASQQFEIDGVSVKVRIAGEHEYITLEGGGDMYLHLNITYTSAETITTGAGYNSTVTGFRTTVTRVYRVPSSIKSRTAIQPKYVGATLNTSVIGTTDSVGDGFHITGTKNTQTQSVVLGNGALEWSCPVSGSMVTYGKLASSDSRTGTFGTANTGQVVHTVRKNSDTQVYNQITSPTSGGSFVSKFPSYIGSGEVGYQVSTVSASDQNFKYSTDGLVTDTAGADDAAFTTLTPPATHTTHHIGKITLTYAPVYRQDKDYIFSGQYVYNRSGVVVHFYGGSFAPLSGTKSLIADQLASAPSPSNNPTQFTVYSMLDGTATAQKYDIGLIQGALAELSAAEQAALTWNLDGVGLHFVASVGSGDANKVVTARFTPDQEKLFNNGKV